ncbi:MAG: hypothetical protein GC186_03415 [Rhodobacteraceae bacterium]|nr:hypothetical protein [Paracoccaceae bacterium]
MTHDYDAQRRETFDTFAEAGAGLPKTAVVDFIFFVEETDANWAAFETALKAKGFATRRLEDGETLVASFGPMPVTPEAIWAQERAATEIALRHDFYPDGWDMDADA